jgi:hypothetical protein
MPKDPLLTQEELAYIHDLLGANGGPAGATPHFPVDSNPQTQALLATLGARAQLTLEARVGGQRLAFPLRLVEDEFRALHLKLDPPRIYEKDHGPVERPWRLQLPEVLILQDRDGRSTGLRVHELSPSGLLLETTESKPPPDFSLWLPLPDQAPLPLQGRYVRTVEGGLHAYCLKPGQRDDLKRLHQYLFQQHRLHPPVPDAPAA